MSAFTALNLALILTANPLAHNERALLIGVGALMFFASLAAVGWWRVLLSGFRVETLEQTIEEQQGEIELARVEADQARDAVEQQGLDRIVQLRNTNKALLQEIKARQEIEKELQRSEQNYRSIVEDQTEMILRFDRLGKITFVNQAYCDRHGITSQQAVGHGCADLLHADFCNQILGSVSVDQPAGPVSATRLHVTYSDGSHDWAEWNGRALFDAGGRHYGFQAVGRIVTDLVAAEARLRESELRYRSIIEDQSEMIVRFDREGRIEFANGAYMRANGLTAETITSANVLQFLPDEDRARVEEKLRSISHDQPAQTDRLRVRRPDGTMEWEDWSARGLYDEEKRFLYFQAVGRNVTQLLQAEELVRAKEDHLRHASRLSTLGEMVAGITHEIRQPLSSISNFAFASQKTLEGDDSTQANKLREWIADIAAQVKRTDEIIRRLRGFARFSGLQQENVSMNEVIEETVKMLRFELNRAEVQVKFCLDNEIRDVLVDRIQIEQVLVNLLRNACDALHESAGLESRWVTITTSQSDSGINVSVQDNGPGVPTNLIDQLFESFQTSKQDGLGLGLAISRSIIEEHGGRIWAENTDPGLRVQFALPVA